MRFSAYLTFITLWSIVVYAPVAHWVWGGGFLAKMGALDFAGGTVVHVNAAAAALVAAHMMLRMPFADAGQAMATGRFLDRLLRARNQAWVAALERVAACMARLAALGGVVLLAEPITARLLFASAAILGGIALTIRK